MTTFTQTKQGTFIDKAPNSFLNKLKLAAAVIVSTSVMAVVFCSLILISLVGGLAAGVALLFRR
jgi:hypothetical protein